MQDIMPPVDTVDNLFHDGNPVTGEQGTIVSAEFLNNLQGATRDTQTELKSILTAAGIAVDPDKQNQVLTALSKLYLSRVNPGADIAADGAAAIATFLANLGLGTAATKNVGTSSGQIPDMSSFVSSRSATSIVLNLPGGYKLMCGQQLAPTDAQGNVFLTLPDTFPTGFIYAEAHQSKISYAGDSDPYIFSSYPSATAPVSQASFAVRNTKSGIALANSSIVCMYFVLGY
ncbi:hypothetical protein [Enterobacter roggenkampii]|uniref:hypothetical protein n=1 Tax=Enterobacter roggenkampii TaxID=1812935 RepID=UPI003BE4AF45